MFFLSLVSAALSDACAFQENSVGGATATEWFQSYWEPCISCCNETRRGRQGDGGKWLCDDIPIEEDSVVISVGSNNEFSFETDIINRYGVKTMRVFDHTSNPSPDKRILFTKKEMTPSRLENIISLVQKNDRTISILKIDCEGCEMSLFSPDTLRSLCIMNTQILIEIHWKGREMVSRLWKSFVDAGFGTFHKEANLIGCKGECIEYAMMRIGNCP